MFTNYSGRILLLWVKEASASGGGGDPTLQLGDAQKVGGGAETIPYFHLIERIIRVGLEMGGGYGEVFLDGAEDGFNF
jgi:hypothetical protein